MLVINVLSQRNPLYTVEAWAETLPLALLWGDTIQASQFNDDALGRILEDLADYGPQLLATLGARMQVVLSLRLIDSPSLTLYGRSRGKVKGCLSSPGTIFSQR